MTTTTAVTAAAARITTAYSEGVPCAPVRYLIGSTDVDAAYATQLLVNQARTRSGARVVGRKIGLTSEAVQAQLGVDVPDSACCSTTWRTPTARSCR